MVQPKVRSTATGGGEQSLHELKRTSPTSLVVLDTKLLKHLLVSEPTYNFETNKGLNPVSLTAGNQPSSWKRYFMIFILILLFALFCDSIAI